MMDAVEVIKKFSRDWDGSDNATLSTLERFEVDCAITVIDLLRSKCQYLRDASATQDEHSTEAARSPTDMQSSLEKGSPFNGNKVLSAPSGIVERPSHTRA